MEYTDFSIICNGCGAIFQATEKTIRYNEYENERTGENGAFNEIRCTSCTSIAILDADD